MPQNQQSIDEPKWLEKVVQQQIPYCEDLINFCRSNGWSQSVDVFERLKDHLEWQLEVLQQNQATVVTEVRTHPAITAAVADFVKMVTKADEAVHVNISVDGVGTVAITATMK